MKKLAKIILSICLLSLFAFSAVGCDDFPNFINPDYQGGTEGNKYVISVTSAGGLPLNNVRVTASKDGYPVMNGISRNGKVEFSLPLDEYTLSFSSLPAGYYIEDGQTFVTSADSYQYSAVFNSKVISSSAVSGTLYKVGDVIHDFTVSDCDGNRLVLSDLVANNKAVMLNFWYRNCGPCRSEFPAIEEAYNVYKNDLKILAISNQDTSNEIADFRDELDLSFNMIYSKSLSSLFGVTAYPTTVIVDRYGVIAYIESGSDPRASFWKTLFDYYTDEDYVQTPSDDEDDGQNGETGEILTPVKPTEQMPESSVLSLSASDQTFSALEPTFRAETNEDDAPYSWPWFPSSEIGGKKFIYPTNEGVDNSFAILYIDFEIGKDNLLSFDYNISTEDNLYIIMNNQILWEFTGNSNGWKTCNLYVFNRETTTSIGITYLKDTAPSENEDFVKLSNFKVTPASQLTAPTDILRFCADTPTSDGDKYQNYSQVELGEDGYYHVKDTGELVLANIAYGDSYKYMTTPWMELRWGNDHIEKVVIEGQTVDFYRNLYYISFWQLSGGTSESFVFNGNDYTDMLIDNYYMQMFSDNQLVPVYPGLKNMIQDFAIQYADNYGGVKHDDLWLEFCGYFQHYGNAHDECFTDIDPVKGMAFHNAIDISVSLPENEISANSVVFDGTAIVDRPLSTKRGTRYKFVAPKSGVYAFRSTNTTIDTDPFLFMYDGDGNYLGGMDIALDADRFDRTNKYGNNFNYYIYLASGEVCYPAFALFFPGETGEYPFKVTYVGATANILTLCTTGEGLFTYDEVTGEDVYIAIDVVAKKANYNGKLTDAYYHLKENGQSGGKVFIDFVHESFFTLEAHDEYGNTIGTYNYTLKELIELNYFGANTEIMNEYYQASIAGKETTDPEYGLLWATPENVKPLNALVGAMQETQDRVMAWRQFACYYAYYGPNA